jgi:hypothetical protein
MRTTPYIVHVKPFEDVWRVTEDGAPESLNTYETHDDALEHARDLAKAAGGGRIVTYNADGTVESEVFHEDDV